MIAEQQADLIAVEQGKALLAFKRHRQAISVGIIGQHQVSTDALRLRYAKVESGPPVKIREAVEHCEGLITVFGGASGTRLIEELRRGSQGTMPWPSLPHAFVQVWDCWQAGAEEQARQIWEQQIHPVIRLGGLVHKEILYRQGVIETPRFRSPAPTLPLDDIAQREFDQVCERLGIGGNGD